MGLNSDGVARTAGAVPEPDPLNASGTSDTADSPHPDPEAGAEQGLDRTTLEGQLLDVLTSWTTRDRGGAFKTWHRHALSLVHLNVLTALEAEGPLSMRRLAEAMDVSDASATGIVDRMEKRGFVERRHATGDRRVVLVYPTAAGEGIFRDMAARRLSVMTRVLVELTEPEMAALLVGLRAVQTARSKILAGDPDPEALPAPGDQPAD